MEQDEESTLVPAIRRGGMTGLVLGVVAALLVGGFGKNVNGIGLACAFMAGSFVGFGLTPFAFLEPRARRLGPGTENSLGIASVAYVLGNGVAWVAALNVVYAGGVLQSGKIDGGLEGVSRFLWSHSECPFYSPYDRIHGFVLRFALLVVPIMPVSIARARKATILEQMVIGAGSAALEMGLVCLLSTPPNVCTDMLMYGIVWSFLVAAYHVSGVADQKLVEWLRDRDGGFSSQAPGGGPR